MRGEESRNAERERRGDGEKSKAKQKEGTAESRCSRQTVRWMGGGIGGGGEKNDCGTRNDEFIGGETFLKEMQGYQQHPWDPW